MEANKTTRPKTTYTGVKAPTAISIGAASLTAYLSGLVTGLSTITIPEGDFGVEAWYTAV